MPGLTRGYALQKNRAWRSRLGRILARVPRAIAVQRDRHCGASGLVPAPSRVPTRPTLPSFRHSRIWRDRGDMAILLTARAGEREWSFLDESLSDVVTVGYRSDLAALRSSHREKILVWLPSNILIPVRVSPPTTFRDLFATGSCG